VLVILDFQSTPNVVHPMNIHVNINLHQQSGFGNKDNQASQEMNSHGNEANVYNEI
jgi:hypothetical protein